MNNFPILPQNKVSVAVNLGGKSYRGNRAKKEKE